MRRMGGGSGLSAGARATQASCQRWAQVLEDTRAKLHHNITYRCTELTASPKHSCTFEIPRFDPRASRSSLPAKTNLTPASAASFVLSLSLPRFTLALHRTLPAQPPDLLRQFGSKRKARSSAEHERGLCLRAAAAGDYCSCVLLRPLLAVEVIEPSRARQRGPTAGEKKQTRVALRGARLRGRFAAVGHERYPRGRRAAARVGKKRARKGVVFVWSGAFPPHARPTHQCSVSPCTNAHAPRSSLARSPRRQRHRAAVAVSGSSGRRQ